MKVSGLIRLFRQWVDDPRGDRWDKVAIIDLLNAGQEEVQEIIDNADELYFADSNDYQVPAQNDNYEGTLPTDFLRAVLFERVVANGRNIPGEYIDYRKRHEMIPDPYDETYTYGLRTTPIWYLKGTKIGVVFPRASYTGRLHYTKKLPDFDDVSDESEIPANYHRLVALSAARQAVLAENREFRHERMFQEWAGKLQTFIERRQKQTARYAHYVEH
jgi:hypothetical protein